MKLEDSRSIFDEDIKFEEILFISDTECFTKEIKKYLLDRIKNEKYKLIVFIGDILSFLEKDEEAFSLLPNSTHIMEIICNYDIGEELKYDYSRSHVGGKISEYISKKYKDYLNNFFSFVNRCEKKGVGIIFYSGNHDSMLSNRNSYFDKEVVPILNKINSLNNFYIPYDFELIKLNKDLYLLGAHTDNNSYNSKDYSYLRDFTQSNKVIEDTNKIIFLSHLPGTLKFKDAGSTDIINFKKKFKFKYHFHGHCRDYNGEYIEEETPTRSVHHKDEIHYSKVK
jgi:predicted MPP superfamily phosphohydrolase